MNGKVLATYNSLSGAVRAGLKSTVARNATSLYLIQFANYIVPLIMVPYLVRVLGPTGYGTVAFAQGFINYLMLFVEYGFDWSATRKISVQRENLEAVNYTAIHVWGAKGILALIGFVVLLALTALVPKLGEVRLLLLALYGLVLGNALFPTWLFQGMERMVAISVINLGMKLSVLAAVFLLVKRPEDAVLYAGLLGGGSLLAGLTGVVASFQMFGLKPSKFSWIGIWKTLREGGVLFLSKVSGSLFTIGNTFILGIFTDFRIVGFYAVAEKVLWVVRVLFVGVLTQALLPRFSFLARDPIKTQVFVKKVARLMFIVNGVFSLMLFLFAPSVVVSIFGPNFIASGSILRVMSIMLPFVTMSNICGFYVMVPFGKEKPFAFFLLTAGLINLCAAFFLVPSLKALGMAISFLASEVFFAISTLIYVSKRIRIKVL